MTKRQIALTAARICGYHKDQRTYTRLFIESRVKRSDLDVQWRIGEDQRAAGVPCSCFECKEAAAAG